MKKYCPVEETHVSVFSSFPNLMPLLAYWRVSAFQKCYNQWTRVIIASATRGLHCHWNACGFQVLAQITDAVTFLGKTNHIYLFSAVKNNVSVFYLLSFFLLKEREKKLFGEISEMFTLSGW